MKVTKDQIVSGVSAYISTEVIPNIGDKATQIVVSIAAKAVKANSGLVDAMFNHPVVKSLLHEDGGKYEIDELFKYIKESVDEYGPFPVTIPAVPFISPEEKTLSFDADDITKIKKKVEASA